MRILTRHLLTELGKIFFVSLTALTLLMIVVGVVREAMQQHLPVGHIVRLIPFILPDALRVAVPVTLLLATTFVYGRMSGNNEIVAAKSLGISPLALLLPMLSIAALLSFATVWLNDLAVSWGRNGARQVVIEAIEEIVYGMLKAQRSYSTENFAINVRRVEGRRLSWVTVSIAARDKTPAMTITAEEAELRADMREKALKIVLRNGAFDVDGKATYQFADNWEQFIPLEDASKAQKSSKVPSWLSLRDIPDEERQQRAVVQRTEYDAAARAAFDMLTGNFASLGGDQWTERLDKIQAEHGHLHRLMTEPHRRWSAGFSCLCFAWVGAPMAIRRRNRDVLTSFFLCFVPILLVYYPLLAWGVEGAKNGSVPPYAVWAGNVLLAAWGGWLLRNVMRY
jgi:lipopolysaccharide export system permease protein